MPRAVGFGVRSKTQQIGDSRYHPHSTALHSQSEFRLLQLGHPVLTVAASSKDAAVLSVAALPCPVPCSCFLRWKQANEERDTVMCSSRRVPFKMCISTLGQKVYAL